MTRTGIRARTARAPDFRRFDDAPRAVAAHANSHAGGTVIPFHSHRRGQLLHTLTGIMRVDTADAAWIVSPARALWIPPGISHRVHMRGHVELRTLYIRADAAAALPIELTLLEISGLLRELMRAVLEERADYDEDGRGGLLARLILTEIERLPGRPLSLPMPRDRRIARITNDLLERPDLRHDLDGWAEAVGASRRTLARLFRAETGLGFAEWRARLRAIEGLSRLSAGGSVAAVAASVGYDSPSAFTAMVRRHLGATPRRLAGRP